MTNHPPSVLWHCWLGHQTYKNRRPYNLYCVGADVKPCSINQSLTNSPVLLADRTNGRAISTLLHLSSSSVTLCMVWPCMRTLRTHVTLGKVGKKQTFIRSVIRTSQCVKC